MPETVRIAIRLPVAALARLDQLAASKFAGNRTRAVTYAVERLKRRWARLPFRSRDWQRRSSF
jgi:hypothetical protein